jgi:uncharacterized protein with FMN-binding domain
MKIELLILAGTIFFIMDTMHDGKYTGQLKSYKKYVKIKAKVETIKKFKVSSLKKVFQICDDNFFH